MPDGARVGKQDASLVHRDVAARLASRFGVGLRDCVNRPPEASSGGEIDPLEGRTSTGPQVGFSAAKARRINSRRPELIEGRPVR